MTRSALRRTRLSIVGLGALLALLSFGATNALANACTWSGLTPGSATDWQVATNWASCGGAVPGTGDSVTVPASVGVGEDSTSVAITNIPTRTVGALTVVDAGAAGFAPQTLTGATPTSVLTAVGASTIAGGSFAHLRISITGGSLTLANSGSLPPVFAAGGLTTATPLALAASRIVLSAAASVELGGNVSGGAGAELVVTGAGSYRQTGSVSTKVRIEAGVSTTLSGATFTAATSFVGPASVIGGNNALNGPTNVFGSSLTISAGTVTVPSGATGSVAGTLAVSGGSNYLGALAFASDIVLTGGESRFSAQTFDGLLTVTTGRGIFADPVFDGDVMAKQPPGASVGGMITTTGSAVFNGEVTLGQSVGLTVDSARFTDHVSVEGPGSIATKGETRFEGTSEIWGNLVGVQSPPPFVVMNGSYVNAGHMTLRANATIAGVALTNEAGHTIVSDPGVSSWVRIRPTLGTFGTGWFTNHGNLEVASGQVVVEAKFNLSATSEVTTRLISAGTTGGTAFTQINVSDHTYLGGSWRLVADSGFPAGTVRGTVLPVLTYKTLEPGTKFAYTRGARIDSSGGYVEVGTPSTVSVNARMERAALALTPDAVRAGEAAVAFGYNFATLEPVSLVVHRVQGGVPTEVVAVATTSTELGAVSSALTIPSGVAPTDDAIAYSVTATGTVSGARVVTPLEILAPAANVTPDPVTPEQKVTTPEIVVAAPTDRDTDGDGLLDSVDCNPADSTKPLQSTGARDANCDGVDDALVPVKFTGVGQRADKVATGAGNDVIRSGGGNDVVTSGAGNDTIDGGAGNDRLDGGAGNDTIAGGAGHDKLVGGSGTDKLNGGPGNDTLNAKDNAAKDTIICGSGKDFVLADKKDKVAADCEKVVRR